MKLVGAFGETLKTTKFSRFQIGDKLLIKVGREEMIGVITNRTPDGILEIITDDGNYEWKRIRTGKDSEYIDLGRGLYAKDKLN